MKTGGRIFLIAVLMTLLSGCQNADEQKTASAPAEPSVSVDVSDTVLGILLPEDEDAGQDL